MPKPSSSFNMRAPNLSIARPIRGSFFSSSSRLRFVTPCLDCTCVSGGASVRSFLLNSDRPILTGYGFQSILDALNAIGLRAIVMVVSIAYGESDNQCFWSKNCRQTRGSQISRQHRPHFVANARPNQSRLSGPIRGTTAAGMADSGAAIEFFFRFWHRRRPSRGGTGSATCLPLRQPIRELRNLNEFVESNQTQHGHLQ